MWRFCLFRIFEVNLENTRKLQAALLGEDKPSFVASSANAPRCRRYQCSSRIGVVKRSSPPEGAKGNRRFHISRRRFEKY